MIPCDFFSSLGNWINNIGQGVLFLDFARIIRNNCILLTLTIFLLQFSILLLLPISRGSGHDSSILILDFFDCLKKLDFFLTGHIWHKQSLNLSFNRLCDFTNKFALCVQVLYAEPNVSDVVLSCHHQVERIALLDLNKLFLALEVSSTVL